ncbi:MAG TPA: signal peptidase I [Candidatus Saccharimonadales bacterium]|nr:signal peptidase I [Candidatus Saccharimonadales bacterium]
MPGSRFSSGLINFFNLIKVAAVLIVLAVMAIVFLGVPLPVDGHSMDPNFATGELVLVQRVNFNASKLQRGDVVAAKFPADASHTRLIKRVIGLPGDTVSAKAGVITVNGQILDESAYGPIIAAPPYQEVTNLKLGSKEYFLCGDNRPGSSDSRLWGPVQASDIQGRISFIVWPLGKLSYINHVTY